MQLFTNILGQSVIPIFQGKAVKKDGTDRLSQNVSKQLRTYNV